MDEDLITTFSKTIQGFVELSVGKTINDVQGLLYTARVNTDLDTDDIALLLGVTPERVEDVIDGDTNINVACLVRYLTTMGYYLELSMVDIKTGEIIHPMGTRRQERYCD